MTNKTFKTLLFYDSEKIRDLRKIRNKVFIKTEIFIIVHLIQQVCIFYKKSSCRLTKKWLKLDNSKLFERKINENSYLFSFLFKF